MQTFDSLNRVSDAGIAGWKELGRTTLGSNGNDLVVSGLSEKRYLMVLANLFPMNHDLTVYSRLGSNTVDTGSNYSSVSFDPQLEYDSSYTSRTNMVMHTGAGTTNVSGFEVGFIANYGTREKIWINNTANSFGAVGTPSNAPHRSQGVGKWANTSAQANIVSYNNYGNGSFGTGCELIILGYDPTDTHTTNFWEELGDIDVTSGTVNTSITAKKYLWIQLYVKHAFTPAMDIRFNSDSGSNYAQILSNNGGTHVSASSQNALFNNIGFDNTAHYINMFIINNQSSDKLVIYDVNAVGTDSAAPQRSKRVGKWANTSSQITSFQLTNDGSSLDRVIGKIWGAD